MQAPEEVSGNPELSEIWERVTDCGRSATASNVDLYVQLCWWYLDLKTCREYATSRSGKAQIFQPAEDKKIVVLPFASEMERAQRAIEAIERQLGAKTSGAVSPKKASVLQLVAENHKKTVND